MLDIEDVERGAAVTHQNTGLRYTVSDLTEEEVLLSPGSSEMEELLVPIELFEKEFVLSGSYRVGGPRRRGRGRSRARSQGPAKAVPAGPRMTGRIKKMVRDRGFGFIRGDDGNEVFFHRSGMSTNEYDVLNEGDLVEYVIQESGRGPRAENVQNVGGVSGQRATS